MNKYFITGSNGFVCKYLLEFLDSLKQNLEVFCVDRNVSSLKSKDFEYINLCTKVIDLKNITEINQVISNFQPNYIVHLASSSSVSNSWLTPADCFINNTNIFLNLIETVRVLDLKCRILSIGSSEEYGIVDEINIPIHETLALHPVSPYAISRVSQEMLSRIYAEKYGLDIILTRSFNHFGFGQKNSFVISSFINNIILARKNGIDYIEVGDISIVRDFLDVRDVVRAYYLLLKHGQKGEVYNVCSGIGYSLKEILDIIVEIVGYNVKYKAVKHLFRPADNPIIVGSYLKIKNAIGWTPQFEIKESIKYILDKTK